MTSMLPKLPTWPMSKAIAYEWVTDYCMWISVKSIKATDKPSPEVLLELLKRVRFVTQRVKGFRIGSGQANETSLRQEVHDRPDDFVFHIAALRQHHPIHNAEIIIILLDKLDAQGIDARVKTTSVPGEIITGLKQAKNQN